MNSKSTALIIVDIQNDYLDPDGAFSRSGLTTPEMRAVPSRVVPVAKTLKVRGGYVAGSLFTLWPDAKGEPMFSPNFKNLKPYLRKGDFAPGSWGQSVIPPLQPYLDTTVYKVGSSAFYNTPLDWILRHAGIDTLAFVGVLSNASVAASVRDAQMREFHCVVLADGCAAMTPAAHDTTIADLKSIAHIMTCNEFTQQLN